MRLRDLSRAKFPCLLIFKEKHEDRYFLINDPADLHNACMKVLKERLKEDYYYSDDEVLDNGRLRQRTEKDIELANQTDMFRKPVLSMKTLAQMIVDGRSKVHPYHFLRLHADYEYEGMEIEHFEQVKE